MAVYVERDASIVSEYKDSTTAYLFVSVAETDGNTEYNATTPLVDQAGNPKTRQQLAADLAAIIVAQRKAKYTVQESTGITGTIRV